MIENHLENVPFISNIKNIEKFNKNILILIKNSKRRKFKLSFELLISLSICQIHNKYIYIYIYIYIYKGK